MSFMNVISTNRRNFLMQSEVPEESKTDEDNPNKCKIVIWDLKWRSSSISIRDPPEEDDQAEENENQEVVDKNQKEVDENQEEVDENQEDKKEDQNKNKKGVSVISSEYDSISSE
ncbi:hypothetical protein RhiirC2_768880 [Rhizophagus irregularis]|uniref:Uncharacterized protein n=1 Tax=Rhizophagus irregularis TaxID=588596 RepID=A0A2N1P0F1_9GLOM|nr:hypothetical protein RhiirC2_768880 [Rhizophagus irregularis]